MSQALGMNVEVFEPTPSIRLALIPQTFRNDA